MNSRLVVRIGNKYDIYWDIFRDFLNSGHVPVQENYILRTQVGSVLKAVKILGEAKGALSTSEFRRRAALSEGSFYNVARDMRLLGLAKLDDSKVVLNITFASDSKGFESALRAHLRDRLQLNRLVSRLGETLKVNRTLTLRETAGLIANWCPYVSATSHTWEVYARIFAIWMDTADLALFDERDGTLSYYQLGTQVRERTLPLGKRRTGITVPGIQYGPVERLAVKLFQVATGGTQLVDWKDFKKTTLAKSLVALAGC